MEVAARGSGAQLHEQGQVLGLGQEQEQPQPLQEREAGVEDQEPKTCKILYVCLASGHFLVLGMDEWSWQYPELHPD